RQDHGRSLQQHEEPLRGHVVLARRHEGLSSGSSVAMSDTRTGNEVAGKVPTEPPSPEQPRAVRPGAREMLVRFLTLREGSIVVVTLLAILYFSVKANHFFTHANFITLLPYFAPFAILAAGEVMLM